MAHGLSLLFGTWNLSAPGIEPVSLTLDQQGSPSLGTGEEAVALPWPGVGGMWELSPWEEEGLGSSLESPHT